MGFTNVKPRLPPMKPYLLILLFALLLYRRRDKNVPGWEISCLIDALKLKSHDTEGYAVFVSTQWVFLILL
jgi:hypothetical protein